MQSLHCFSISNFRNNHIFLIRFMSSVTDTRSLHNFINNKIHIIVKLLFFRVEKLTNLYTSRDSILLCQVSDSFFNFLINGTLSIFLYFNKFSLSLIILFAPISRSIPCTRYFCLNPIVFNYHPCNILLSRINTLSNCL